MSALKLDLSFLETYTISQLTAFCKERGLSSRGATKAEYAKSLEAYEESHRNPEDGQDKEGDEEIPLDEEGAMVYEERGLQKPTKDPSVNSDPGISVYSRNITPSQLADRRAARQLQLKMLKQQIAADDKKAEAENSVAKEKAAAEERRAEADRDLEEKKSY